MVGRLAVPKAAAMVVNVGAVERLPDGGEEMAAVAEQDADGVEDEGDVLGHGAAGLILGWIGRRGWTGSGGYVGFHVCYSNFSCPKVQGLFSAGQFQLNRGSAAARRATTTLHSGKTVALLFCDARKWGIARSLNQLIRIRGSRRRRTSAGAGCPVPTARR